MSAFLALAAAAATGAPACIPVRDAATLWAEPETRWVIVGEQHGTNEIPDAFANLVCLAAQARGPVTVAIEYPVEMQPVLDAWLASDGGADAREALLAAPLWNSRFQDGRASVAFLRMFDRLRLLHVAGKVVSVRAFDVPFDGSEKGDRNAAMARRLTAIADAAKGLTLVLVGNIHARRDEVTFGSTTIRPAAFLLPAAQRVTVDINARGGTMWNCQMQGCHVYTSGAGPARPAGLRWDMSANRNYDVIYMLATPFSAAEPAVPGVADTNPIASMAVKP
jgi:hypothetical protein